MHLPRPPVMLLLPLVMLISAGCQRDDEGGVVATDPDQPRVSEAGPPLAPVAAPDAGDDVLSAVPHPIERPAAGTITPPLAEGADITYTCEDGSDLRVNFAGGRASITFATGRAEPLARAQPADGGVDGELYLGAVHGLHRIGTVVELRQEDGSIRRCRETGGSA